MRFAAGQHGVVAEVREGAADLQRLGDLHRRADLGDDRRQQLGLRRSNASQKRCSAAERSAGVSRGQGPSSNARRAAATAASTCAGEADGIVASSSSVAG